MTSLYHFGKRKNCNYQINICVSVEIWMLNDLWFENWYYVMKLSRLTDYESCFWKRCAPLTQLAGHLSEVDSLIGYDVNQSTDSRCSLRKLSRLDQAYLNPDCTPLIRSFLALKFATIPSQSMSTGKYNFREQ